MTKLENFLLSSPDGLAELDLEGRFRFVNEAAARMIGHSREEIPGKTNRELGVPDDLAGQFEEDIRRVLADGEPLTRIFEHNGSTYESRLVPMRNGKGEIESVCSYTRDITDRTQLEQLKGASLQFAREVIHASPKPMLILSGELDVISVNPAFHDLFGTVAEQVEARRLPDLLSDWPETGFELDDWLREALKDDLDRIRSSRAALDMPRRGIRSVRLYASRIDHLNLVLLSVEDVTEQIRTINALREDLEDSEDELRAKTERLRQLVVELSDTEDRERARLSELLHDDVQQILVGIQFHLQMIRDQKQLDPAGTELLEESLALMKEVVAKTRTLSHELYPMLDRSGSLRDALIHLADEMMRLHKLEVAVEVEGKVDCLDESVRNLLLKAMQEILFNIVKHAEVDRATVDVRRENGTIEVWVRDHGKGFDAKAVLGNRFGKGLGLFTLRERLTHMEGALKVESVKGHGSTFHLRVPVTESEWPGAGPSPETEATYLLEETVIGDATGEVLRLVLVDDHRMVRESLARLLNEHSRLEVVGQAGDGREAVNLIKGLRPDLVLMDLAMPGMDGVEATRRIKAFDPDIRVVGLSMVKDQDRTDDLVRAGAEAFVPKTTVVAELYEKIFTRPLPPSPLSGSPPEPDSGALQ